MPGDYREFFDIRRLDDQQLGQIEFVLNSPAYEQSFKPYMEGILRQMTNMWRDRSRQRQDTYPDDFLAGGAVFAEGLIKFFDLVIQETRMERIHASMGNPTNDQQYDIRRESGQVKPVVGLDQPALPQPVDPAAEDY